MGSLKMGYQPPERPVPPENVKTSGSLWDGLYSIAIFLLAASFLLRLMSWRDEQAKLRDAIAAIAADVAAIDQRVTSGFMHPRFARHVFRCRQCRGDEPSAEGGPSPLCERGFKLMQQDMAELKGEESE